MSSVCPNCETKIPLIRGVDIRPARLAGESWLRYDPSRFFCRKCDAELSFKTLPAGYALNVIFAAYVLGLGAFLNGAIPFVSAPRLSGAATIGILLTIAPVGVLYVLCLSRWGVMWQLAMRSNYRLERP